MLMDFDIPDWVRKQAIEKERLVMQIITSQEFIDDLAKKNEPYVQGKSTSSRGYQKRRSLFSRKK